MVRSALANWGSYHQGGTVSQSATSPQLSLGLHRGAAVGNAALVLYALESGQSPNSALHGVMPLHVAAATGNVLILKLLLAYGADANAARAKTRQVVPGTEGSTPLHFAAANGHTQIVRLLLDNGAKPAPYDRDVNTPEALAQASGHENIAAMLAQHPHPAGHTVPGSVRDLGYVPDISWGSVPILGDTLYSRERPRTGSAASSASFSHVPSPTASPRPTPSVSPALMHVIPRSSSAAPAQPRSKTASPPWRDPKRPSLPNIFEKAVSPAASLRAAISSHASAGDDDEPVQVPQQPRYQLAPSKKSISAILRRATGAREPSPPPTPLQSSPIDMAPAREMHTPPSTSAPQSAKQLTPRSRARVWRERQPRPPDTPAYPATSAKGRRSSISGLVPAVDDKGRLRPHLLRARANSETKAPENSLLGGTTPEKIPPGISPNESPGTSPGAESLSSVSPGPNRSDDSSARSALGLSPRMSTHPLSMNHSNSSISPIHQISPPSCLAPPQTGASPQLHVDTARSNDNVATAAGMLRSVSPSNVSMSAEVLAQLLESQGTDVDEYGHSPLAMILAEVGDQISGSSRGDHGHV